MFEIPTPYDPKLKEAMGKIEAICKEYDCGGFFSLISKSHGEFKVVLVDWIGITEESNNRGSGYRIKLKGRADDPESRALADLTAFFIFSLRDVAERLHGFLSHMAKEIEKKAHVEHNFTIHRDNPKDRH